MTQFQHDQFTDEYADKPESNPLGIVGFILSILCITSPLGLLISIIAIFKRPRGFAIAGTILGLLGSLVITAVVVFALVAGPVMFPVFGLSIDMARMRQQFEEYAANNQSPPDSLAAIGWTDTDPWDNDYIYTFDLEAQTWTIRSMGPDGVAENEDDFVIDSSMSQSEQSAAIGEWTNKQVEEKFGGN